MPNPVNPMTTNITPSGKKLNASSQLEFDLGLPNSSDDRVPLVLFQAANMAFDQCIPFSVNIAAAQEGYNLWEADAEELRARAVMIVCRYGGGGILINPDGDPLPFPLATIDPTEPAWFMYCNPSGSSLEVTVAAAPVQTGPGIQKITADTENESRFDGFIFV